MTFVTETLGATMSLTFDSFPELASPSVGSSAPSVRPSLYERLQALSHDERVALVERLSWYHCIDLGGGLVTKGTYDLRPVLNEYGFPDDLSGKRVLDVGRSSGFFAFELERRGAQVTATELPRILDKDYVGGELAREALAKLNWDEASPEVDDEFGDRLDFALAHVMLGSHVKPVSVRLDQIGPETVPGGPFDLVFVGSLLNHVSDPIGALRNVASVLSGTCVIANVVDPHNTSSAPSARLVGRDGTGLTTWWLPNVAGLVEMLYCAGFEDVVVVNPALGLPRPGTEPLLHAIIRANAPRDRAASVERWHTLLRDGPLHPLPPPKKRGKRRPRPVAKLARWLAAHSPI